MLQADTYRAEDIVTLTYNKSTVFVKNERLAEKIMENGKNPGLGVRALHEKGITGQGVNVAIIDQNLILDHPEYAHSVQMYYDTGCDAKTGSMHAPAVLSLLSGNTIGVAPDAKVYFAAAPSWTGDSKYYADALNWIIEQNQLLPENNKIRAVSISAAPSGEGSFFVTNHHLYDEAVAKAKKEGILVLDCRIGYDTGYIIPAYYDPANPEDVEKCSLGFPGYDSFDGNENCVAVPCSYRTVAEKYFPDVSSYQYTGQGGLSWGIPYATGILALGWQINPDLTGDEMIELLKSSAYLDDQKNRFINPAAFISAVEKTLTA